MSDFVPSARGVTKRFGRRAVLDGLDFEPAPGSITVLLGRNGAGKSTLLKLWLGVLRPDAGRVRVGALDPARAVRRVRSAVGYVPDRPDVYPWMTANDLFRFLAPQYPTWNRDAQSRIGEQLGLPLDRPFRSMSRGEGMKAMLVAALAPEPPLLLLDEPFAGLDPVVREEVLKGLLSEFRAGEQTVVVTTHDLDVAARIADRVAVLSSGRIVEQGAPGQPQELLQKVTAS